MMTFKEYRALIWADFERTRIHQVTHNQWKENDGGLKNYMHFLLSIFLYDTFAIMYWYRLGSYLKAKQQHGYRRVFYLPLYIIIKSIYKFVEHWVGVDIPLGGSIGGGLRMDHCNAIVIAKSAKIGNNCTILNGVSLGRSFGDNGGVPQIGNNCVIYTGAKLIGNIKLGNNVIVGANSVVTKDFPDNCVIAGIPAKIISNNWEKAIAKKWRQYYGFE